MGTYYLAVDIGASSGRHILGTVSEGKIILKEIYRFSNGMKPVNGHLCWDTNTLFHEIKEGMKRCKTLGTIPVSMGIDTWAVDFVLMDQEGKVLGESVGYRDHRTIGMDEEVYKIISPQRLYERTGIQKQIFNTVYQLMALKKQQPQLLETAHSMLMIPDYFHYLLTGVKKQEYTNGTTTQLVSPVTKQWDYDLIESLGYPSRLFSALSMPGTEVGMLSAKIEKEVGFTCQVVLPATHDTGSAVMAVPSAEPRQENVSSGSLEDDVLYISSGTWSLMGTERMEADCTWDSMNANFTNEGGYDYRFRYLKNIMGLWMIQSVKKEWGEEISFAQLCDLATQSEIASLVDCNDQVFLAPENMTKAVQDYCQRTHQQVPETVGEIGAVIYNSLALCYRDTARELEGITGKTYPVLHIVGGGANADYLNRLTAKYSGKEVQAGPTEATAIGNLLAQMLKAGEFASLKEARACVQKSFDMKVYVPEHQKG